MAKKSTKYVYDKNGNAKLDTAGFPIKKINSYLTTDIKEVVMIGGENKDG